MLRNAVRQNRIASVPPISSHEAAEDALKQINHEICIELLRLGEVTARHAGMLREIAPHLHDELLSELRQQNKFALEV